MIDFLRAEQQRLHAQERRHHQILDALQQEEEQAVLDLVGALGDTIKAKGPAEAAAALQRFEELQQQLAEHQQRLAAWAATVDTAWPAYTGRFEAALQAHVQALRAPPQAALQRSNLTDPPPDD